VELHTVEQVANLLDPVMRKVDGSGCRRVAINLSHSSAKTSFWPFQTWHGHLKTGLQHCV